MNTNSELPASSSAGKHLDYLDGWRGLAILFLLIGHFFPVPGINLGRVGVSLFFVLSGYLMGRLLFIEEIPISVFYRRRISRIIPAHVFFLGCVIAYFVATETPINWSETLAAFFFVNNYFSADLGNSVMPFGHIWSLSVEEHSYIILSLVAIAARNRWVKAKWMIAALTIGFSATGFWYWTRYTGSELDFGKWVHTEVSAYGIFVSAFLVLFLVDKKLPTLPALVYPLLLLTGILMHWWSIPSPIKTTVGLALFALLLNLLSSAPSIIKKLLAFRPLRMMGLWSFSIYLWQQPFYLATHNGTIPSYLAIAMGILAGIASFYCLEQPLRTYLNEVWGRRKQSRVVGIS